MRKIILLLLSICVLVLPLNTMAANEAVFTITSQKTNYSVGENIQISLNVDAGAYATTLSVIDFDLKISDTAVAELEDQADPLVPGDIFSTAGIQSVEGDIINAVVYVSPTEPPASRSGVIGTINFRALKEGAVTFSYDRIEAAEESTEDDYVTTSASSLTVTIGSSSSVKSSSSSSVAGTTSYSYSTPTPTVKSATTTASTATTGPEMVLILSGSTGLAIYFLKKRFNRIARKV